MSVDVVHVHEDAVDDVRHLEPRSRRLAPPRRAPSVPGRLAWVLREHDETVAEAEGLAVGEDAVVVDPPRDLLEAEGLLQGQSIAATPSA